MGSLIAIKHLTHWMIAMALAALLSSSLSHAQKITTFDCPKSTGTLAMAINRTGTITGSCSLPVQVDPTRGFVRGKDGTFSIFGVAGSTVTQPNAINAAGEIAGQYMDTHTQTHAFIRAVDGTITAFDYPGATVTQAFGLNDTGWVVGYYFANGAGHAFMRDPQGNMTNIDPPGTAFTALAAGINNEGVITGQYEDASANYVSFVRDQAGNFTTYQAPGDGVNRTFASGINSAGQVTGSFSAPGNSEQGYLRNADGTFVTIAPPGATFALPLSINSKGSVVGYAADATNTYFGFLRLSSGNLIVITVPAAGHGGNRGTVTKAVNDSQVVTGYFQDNSGVFHGFLAQ